MQLRFKKMKILFNNACNLPFSHSGRQHMEMGTRIIMVQLVSVPWILIITNVSLYEIHCHNFMILFYNSCLLIASPLFDTKLKENYMHSFLSFSSILIMSDTSLPSPVKILLIIIQNGMLANQNCPFINLCFIF